MKSQPTPQDQPVPVALRPTPETAKVARAQSGTLCGGANLEFARKLERERDEESLHVAKLKQEREELWKEIAAAKHGDSGYAVLQERHEKELAEMQRQRDEARDDAERLAKALLICRHAPACDCGRDAALTAHSALTGGKKA